MKTSRSFGFAPTNEGGRDLLIQHKQAHKNALRTVKSVIDTTSPKAYLAKKLPPKHKALALTARPSTQPRKSTFSHLTPSKTFYTTPQSTTSTMTNSNLRPVFRLDLENVHKMSQQASTPASTKTPSIMSSPTVNKHQSLPAIASPASTSNVTLSATMEQPKYELQANEKETYQQFVTMLANFSQEKIAYIVHDAKRDGIERSLLANYQGTVLNLDKEHFQQSMTELHDEVQKAVSEDGS